MQPTDPGAIVVLEAAKFLYSPDVISVEQMRGERVPRRMASDAFVRPGDLRGLLDSAIDDAEMGVPANAARVLVQSNHGSPIQKSVRNASTFFSLITLDGSRDPALVMIPQKLFDPTAVSLKDSFR